MANADFTAICSVGPEKYDNQKWEVVVYESGTTIVIPKGLEKASHFLIYGPKVEPEASRDSLRHKRAEELALFLNTNSRPKWMNLNPKIEYLCQMTMSDGTDISCVSTTCGESEACELFNWFGNQLVYSFMSDAISSEMDKKCLEFMIEASKTVKG